MNQQWVSLSSRLPSLSRARKDALIAQMLGRVDALTRQVEDLTARMQDLESENAVLRAENATLREKLTLPPKTPNNSSLPPSRGQKANEEPGRKPKAKAHAGAHRPLHPNPTRTRDVLVEECPHCRADVSGVAQTEVDPKNGTRALIGTGPFPSW